MGCIRKEIVHKFDFNYVTFYKFPPVFEIKNRKTRNLLRISYEIGHHFNEKSDLRVVIALNFIEFESKIIY